MAEMWHAKGAPALRDLACQDSALPSLRHCSATGGTSTGLDRGFIKGKKVTRLQKLKYLSGKIDTAEEVQGPRGFRLWLHDLDLNFICSYSFGKEQSASCVLALNFERCFL